MALNSTLVTSRLSTTCVICYLPHETTREATEDVVRKLCEPYGTVTKVEITSKWIMVDFATIDEAQATATALDKFSVKGRNLSASVLSARAV